MKLNMNFMPLVKLNKSLFFITDIALFLVKSNALIQKKYHTKIVANRITAQIKRLLCFVVINPI